MSKINGNQLPIKKKYKLIQFILISYLFLSCMISFKTKIHKQMFVIKVSFSSLLCKSSIKLCYLPNFACLLFIRWIYSDLFHIDYLKPINNNNFHHHYKSVSIVSRTLRFKQNQAQTQHWCLCP